MEEFEYDAFISYSTADQEWVEGELFPRLEELDIRYIDYLRFQLGRPRLNEIERAVQESRWTLVILTPAYLQDTWQQFDSILATSYGLEVGEWRLIPVIKGPCELPPRIRALVSVDLRTDDPDEWDRLLGQLSSQPLPPQLPKPMPVDCPYRGLEPFEAQHAEFYFGREAMVERLVAKVKESDFVAVVGPSGCGKSSLVRAGLMTALREGALPGSEEWAVRVFRPGADPLRALCTPLIQLLEPEATEVQHMAEARDLADLLCEGKLPLSDITARLKEKRPDVPCLLLIADQFEELYTECDDEALRQAFVAGLLAAAGQGIKVVLTLRADFYGRVLAEQGLDQAVDAGLVNVLPMSEEELRAAIEQPALQTGRAFEPGLVERILADVLGEPGNLPLLEFALTGLWDQQTTAGVLTHEGYETIGKVEGAIAQRAEAVYAELEGQGQGETVRRVLTRLSHYGEREGTRSPATLNDLVTLRTPQAEVENVVQTLAAKEVRLLVTGAEAAEVATVEVAHEALIRSWERLRRWLDDDRAFGLWRERLAAARGMWEETEQDEGWLLHDATLAEAEGWLEDRREDLNEAEWTFIAASLAVRERDRRAGERTRNALIGVAIVVAVVMAALGVFGMNRAREAQYQATVALARRLAAQAELVRASAKGSWNVAGLLAVESLHRVPNTAEAMAVVYRVLEGLGRPVSRLEHDDSVWSVAFRPDGQWVATASGYAAWVWDISAALNAGAGTGVEVARLEHEGVVESVAFSADGEWVATASGYMARVWDISAALHAGTGVGVEVARLEHDSRVYSVAFSPDGQWVATASGRTARVWVVPENLVDTLCSGLTRNLTRQEWVHYLGDEPYRKTCRNLPDPAD